MTDNKRSFFLAALLLHLACSSNPGPPLPSKDSKPASPPSPAPTVRFADLPVKSLERYRVTLTTSLGKVEIKPLPQQAPETVRQFLSLCQMGLYDHTAWH